MKFISVFVSFFFLIACFSNQPSEREARATMQDYLKNAFNTGFQEGVQNDETGLGGLFGAALLGDIYFKIHEFELLDCDSQSSKIAYCEVYIDYEMVSRNPDASMLSLFTLFGAQTRMSGTEKIKFVQIKDKWVAST